MKDQRHPFTVGIGDTCARHEPIDAEVGPTGRRRLRRCHVRGEVSSLLPPAVFPMIPVRVPESSGHEPKASGSNVTGRADTPGVVE